MFMNSVDKIKKEVNKKNENVRKEYEEKYKKMIDEVANVKKEVCYGSEYEKRNNS